MNLSFPSLARYIDLFYQIAEVFQDGENLNHGEKLEIAVQAVVSSRKVGKVKIRGSGGLASILK